MSLVIAEPEVMSAVAADLSGIGSMLDEARVAAAGATTAIPAAAADEVSTAVAALLSGHGQQFQVLGARAAVFHEDFAKTLGQSAGIYAGSEAVNAAALASAGLQFGLGDALSVATAVFQLVMADPESLLVVPFLLLLLAGFVTGVIPVPANGF